MNLREREGESERQKEEREERWKKRKNEQKRWREYRGVRKLSRSSCLCIVPNNNNK